MFPLCLFVRRWIVTFATQLGDLPMMFSRPETHEIQSVSTVGGDPTPIVGTFTLTFAGETTSPIPYDASEETFKVGCVVVSFSPRPLVLIP